MSSSTDLSGVLEHPGQVFALDSVALSFANLVNDKRATLASGLAAAALLLRFEVE